MQESSWRVKLERAREHEVLLVREVDRFFELSSHKVETSREDGDIVLRVHNLAQPPDRISLIFGDAVHNARSALDHLIISCASHGNGTSGRAPTVEEEMHLSFPVTKKQGDFSSFVSKRRLSEYLSDDTIERIRHTQPWATSPTALAMENGRFDTVEALARKHALERLTQLDNWDKHRRISTALWFSGGVEVHGEFGPTIQIELPFELKSLDEANEEQLQAINEALDSDLQRPDAVDFYFGASLLSEGSEIGRFIRNDHQPIEHLPPPIEADLRLVIYEHGLTGAYRGAPDLRLVAEELLNTVEVVCQYVEGFS